MTLGNRLRLGLVGVGHRGRAHLGTIAGMADLFDLVAICDPSQRNLQGATDFKGTAYIDAREFFAAARLDAAIMATPPESHHGLAALAAQYGVHLST